MGNSNKYWKGIEELEPIATAPVNKGNEFSESLPMDEIFGDAEELSSNRRDFLKFFGFSVSAVALAACNKAPIKYAIPYINKPETVTPGVPLYYATSCGVYNEGFPIMAKVREGRPIKLDGNPNSPLSQGGLDATGQASILSLYDTNRIPNPVINGEEVADWTEVDNQVVAALKAGSAKGIHVVTRTVTSPIMKASIDAFIAAYPGAKHVVYDPISYSGITSANQADFGKAIVPNYHFDKAEVIVSFGADFLGTWISPVRFQADYSKGRVPSPENANMSKHYQIESLMSVTGTNADYRFPIQPSKQGLYLANLYNKVASKTGNASLSGIESHELAGNSLDRIATELVAAKGKSLVVCGSNNQADQQLANGINNMLGNYGSTIDMSKGYTISTYSESAFDAFVADVKGGRCGAAVFVNCNPVYSYHKGESLAGMLSGVSVISTSMTMDETTQKAGFICPDNHWLESWDVHQPMEGSITVSQPVIGKVFNTRAAAESLRAWAGEKLEAAENDQASHTWVVNYLTAQGLDVNQTIHDGLGAVSGGSSVSYAGDVSSAAADVAKRKPASGMEMVLYQKVGPKDGTWAMNPWCHELPDPVTKVVYDNYVTMSKSDAAANGFEQGDWLKVTCNGSTIEKLPLLIQPGQARGTVGVALGYGRKAVNNNDNDLTDLGQNAYPMVSVSGGRVNYHAGTVTLEKVDSGYEFAQTQTHNSIEGRDFMREATLDEYRDHNNVRNEHKPHIVSLWEEYDYSKGHHWGMAVDMNACTGCGSCIVSCSIENNVPVVGRKEVRRRREMHWIRVDRYYAFEVAEDATASVRVGPSHIDKDFHKGEFSTKENELAGLDKLSKEDNDYSHYDNVTVVHQPVMCQHCDHAPCETVCPVLATTHSSEGLNQMTYNRCIGTKYCGNNCPYKVRRFNWFRYNLNPNFDYHFNTELGRMVLNPDVTVRSRGVMEKCSFCVQNIQMAKLQAKRENRKLQDGEAHVACAKACPSNAIVFGDRNDPNSAIAKMFANERAYKMLEEIDTAPSVVYLTKIRNRKENSTEVHHS
ncbi:MAG: TAT-variant-translocated molybdopterin oxidoreductase [Flavobacteriales bacterium]|nr:TAT-variant-translocated molybdopterin oxidoreductase [Bacteroidota bacterium]MCB9241075.1 TAT-variant-translocated molybdopterin oxidoreductase [Flavobacteriales bacterium]